MANSENIMLINDLASAKYEKIKRRNYNMRTFPYRKKFLKIKNIIRKTRIFKFIYRNSSKKITYMELIFYIKNSKFVENSSKTNNYNHA